MTCKILTSNLIKDLYRHLRKIYINYLIPCSPKHPNRHVPNLPNPHPTFVVSSLPTKTLQLNKKILSNNQCETKPTKYLAQTKDATP